MLPSPAVVSLPRPRLGARSAGRPEHRALAAGGDLAGHAQHHRRPSAPDDGCNGRDPGRPHRPGPAGNLDVVRVAHEKRVAAGDHDGWLLGHGWSVHHLGRWPEAELLERVAPGRPVALYAHDHHARWISQAAVTLAQIDGPRGAAAGELVRRDDAGLPSGILHEGGLARRLRHSDPTADELVSGLAQVAARLAALGVTGCHDPGELTSGLGDEAWPRLLPRASGGRDAATPCSRLAARTGAVGRDRAGLASGQAVIDSRLVRSPGRFTMGWLKLFADGSLGSRSAALLEPYSDADVNPPTGGPLGMVVTDAHELAATCWASGRGGRDRRPGSRHRRRRGSNSARHPPGVAVRRAPGTAALMPRIEHAQLVIRPISPASARSALPRPSSRFTCAAMRCRQGRLGRTQRRTRSHCAHWWTAVRSSPSGRTRPSSRSTRGRALPWPSPGAIPLIATRRRPALIMRSASRERSARPVSIPRSRRRTEQGRLLPGYRADLLVIPAGAFREPFMPADFASTRPHATLIDGDVVHRLNAFDP